MGYGLKVLLSAVSRPLKKKPGELLRGLHLVVGTSLATMISKYAA
jgi:hypothetical protein